MSEVNIKKQLEDIIEEEYQIRSGVVSGYKIGAIDYQRIFNKINLLLDQINDEQYV